MFAKNLSSLNARVPGLSGSTKMDQSTSVQGIKIAVSLLLVLLALKGDCLVNEIKINMEAIRLIESAGCDSAVNPKSGAAGAYQITPICLKDYNQYHPVKYSMTDLKKYNINHRIATWYITTRIPELLKAFMIPVTLETVLIAYNAGVSWCRVLPADLPKETIKYIEKYKALENISNGRPK